MSGYEDSIRRVAARSVRDLKIDLNGASCQRENANKQQQKVSEMPGMRPGSMSGSMSGSGLVSTGGRVSVASVRSEYLKKINSQFDPGQGQGQFKVILTNGNGQGQGQMNVMLTNGEGQGRRQSDQGQRQGQQKMAFVKSTSDSNVQQNSYIDRQALLDRHSIISASKLATPTLSEMTHNDLNRQDISLLANGNHYVLQQRNTYSAQSNCSNVSDPLDQYHPGSYPQFNHSTLSTIPIYENLEGYPAVPRRGQATPPPPPPPYQAKHNIMSKSNSRTSLSSVDSVKSCVALKPPVLPPKSNGSTGHYPPYVAPPVYENVYEEENVSNGSPSLSAQLAAARQQQLQQLQQLQQRKSPVQQQGLHYQHQHELVLRQQLAAAMSNQIFRDYVNLPPPPPYPGMKNNKKISENNGSLSQPLKSTLLTRSESHGSSSDSSNGYCVAADLARMNLEQNKRNLEDEAAKRRNGPSTLKAPLLPFSITPPKAQGPSEAERKLEVLTKQIEEQMEKEEEAQYFGDCFSCGKKIFGSDHARQVQDNVYHTECFVCVSCGRSLWDKGFYNVHGKIYCEEDYMYSGFQQTSEKCSICGHLIMETILKAMGNTFHPGCFRCCVCNDCLDGVPFTVDFDNKIYCVNDFHRIFAPKCAACGDPITPLEDTEETVRVVAMEKDFHVDCYVCQVCQVQLTDEPDKRCYPLGEHLLCKQCHVKQLGGVMPQDGELQGVSAEYNILSS